MNREENKEDKDTNGRHSENNDEKKQKNFNQTSNIIKIEEQSNQVRRHEYEQSKCSYREEPNAVEGNSSNEKNKEDSDVKMEDTDKKQFEKNEDSENDGEYTTKETTMDFTPQVQNQDDQSDTSNEEDWNNNKKY